MGSLSCPREGTPRTWVVPTTTSLFGLPTSTGPACVLSYKTKGRVGESPRVSQ